jgi:hypothetical protein
MPSIWLPPWDGTPDPSATTALQKPFSSLAKTPPGDTDPVRIASLRVQILGTFEPGIGRVGTDVDRLSAILRTKTN